LFTTFQAERKSYGKKSGEQRGASADV